jgi:hypothetical protein
MLVHIAGSSSLNFVARYKIPGFESIQLFSGKGGWRCLGSYLSYRIDEIVDILCRVEETRTDPDSAMLNGTDRPVRLGQAVKAGAEHDAEYLSSSRQTAPWTWVVPANSAAGKSVPVTLEACVIRCHQASCYYLFEETKKPATQRAS